VYCGVLRSSRLLSARRRAAKVRAVAGKNGVARAGASRVSRANASAVIFRSVPSTLATTSAERGP